MANKKDMMFTLARLGCDWRARAEGIDGATAAFVLCGQHTRTTRQQVPHLPHATMHRFCAGWECALCVPNRLCQVACESDPNMHASDNRDNPAA